MSDGLELDAAAWGDQTSPPLLLAPGGQTGPAWTGLAEALAQDGWFSILLDLRGVEDIERTADHLITVSLALTTAPVVIGGAWGAGAARRAAGRSSAYRQDLFRALVLVGEPPGADGTTPSLPVPSTALPGPCDGPAGLLPGEDIKAFLDHLPPLIPAANARAPGPRPA